MLLPEAEQQKAAETWHPPGAPWLPRSLGPGPALGEGRLTVEMIPRARRTKQEVSPSQEDCVPERGQHYQGRLAVTSQGAPCLPWASEQARSLSKGKGFSPEVKLEENFCRNPNKDEEGAWCFVAGQNEDFQYCDLNYCGKWQGCRQRRKGQRHCLFATAHCVAMFAFIPALQKQWGLALCPLQR